MYDRVDCDRLSLDYLPAPCWSLILLLRRKNTFPHSSVLINYATGYWGTFQSISQLLIHRISVHSSQHYQFPWTISCVYPYPSHALLSVGSVSTSRCSAVSMYMYVNHHQHWNVQGRTLLSIGKPRCVLRAACKLLVKLNHTALHPGDVDVTVTTWRSLTLIFDPSCNIRGQRSPISAEEGRSFCTANALGQVAIDLLLMYCPYHVLQPEDTIIRDG